jgi:hypothetical protein
VKRKVASEASDEDGQRSNEGEQRGRRPLAYVSLRALLHCAGGLHRLLYLNSLHRDLEDVQAGYAAQLARSFHVLA